MWQVTMKSCGQFGVIFISLFGLIRPHVTSCVPRLRSFEVKKHFDSFKPCSTPILWQETLKSCGHFVVIFLLDFVWPHVTSYDPRLTLTKPWIPDIPVSHIQSKWDLLEETEHNRELNLHEQLKRQERLNALASNFQKKEIGCKPRKKFLGKSGRS